MIESSLASSQCPPSFFVLKDRETTMLVHHNCFRHLGDTFGLVFVVLGLNTSTSPLSLGGTNVVTDMYLVQRKNVLG